MAKDPHALFNEEQVLFDAERDETVHRAVQARIREEALRQLDTVDLDSDDSRMESLPPLDGGESGCSTTPPRRRRTRHLPTT